MHLIDKPQLINILLRVFFMIDLSLHHHRIVAQLEIVLGSNHFSRINWKFILRIQRLKNWNTYWLSFELTVASVLKRYLRHCFILGAHIAVNFAFLLKFLGPKHDSSSQIDYITENRELLSRPWSSHYSREDISRSYSNITPCLVNLFESFPQIKSSEDSSLSIISVCHWAKSPNAN